MLRCVWGLAVARVVAAAVETAADPNSMGYALLLSQQSLGPALTLAWLLWIGAIGFDINADGLRLQRLVARRRGEVVTWKMLGRRDLLSIFRVACQAESRRAERRHAFAWRRHELRSIDGKTAACVRRERRTHGSAAMPR